MEDLFKGNVACVINPTDFESAVETIQKLADLGYSVFEITLRNPKALEILGLLLKEFPDKAIGAGTIISKEQMEAVIQLGAKFSMSPGLDDELVILAQSKDHLYVPGVSTPSEIQKCLKLGLDLMKLFPASSLGGVGYIKAVSAAFPQAKFLPTGGVNGESFQSYLELPSVYAVGGSWMLK